MASSLICVYKAGLAPNPHAPHFHIPLLPYIHRFTMTLSINKEGKTLDITITGVESLLSVQKSFSVQLANIRLPVVPNPEEAHGWWHGMRVGTNIPGLYTSGTFYSLDASHTKSFYHMRDPKQTILISLKNEDYDKLILEVDPQLTPEEMARNIREQVEEVLWAQQDERRRSAEYENLVVA